MPALPLGSRGLGVAAEQAEAEPLALRWRRICRVEESHHPYVVRERYPLAGVDGNEVAADDAVLARWPPTFQGCHANWLHRMHYAFHVH